MQMEDENIEIPIVYITSGWAVDDLETVEDCEDAHILLTSTVAAIEEQLEGMVARGEEAYRIGKAKSALKWRKLALQLVAIRRAKITRLNTIAVSREHEKLMLTYIGSEHPKVHKEANDWATARRNKMEIEKGTTQ